MIIRQISIADTATLQAISKQTFYETFAATNTEADIQQYLQTSFATDKVQQELTNPHSIFFLQKRITRSWAT